MLSALQSQVTHEVLVELEFTSERARMSVVARAPDGTIRLLCKGSDAVMLPRLRPGTDAALLRDTDANLHAFSVKGLRTLVITSKVRSCVCWRRWMRMKTPTPLLRREQATQRSCMPSDCQRVNPHA